MICDFFYCLIIKKIFQSWKPQKVSNKNTKLDHVKLNRGKQKVNNPLGRFQETCTVIEKLNVYQSCYLIITVDREKVIYFFADDCNSSCSYCILYLFHRERERVEGQRAARNFQSAPPLPTKQQQQDTERRCKEQNIQARVHMQNLKVGACTECVVVFAGWNNSVTCGLVCICVHVFSVSRGISPGGIRWCWTEGDVWIRPRCYVTGGGSWEHGERGGQWCGQNKSNERCQELSRSCELKTGENLKEIVLFYHRWPNINYSPYWKLDYEF